MEQENDDDLNDDVDKFLSQPKVQPATLISHHQIKKMPLAVSAMILKANLWTYIFKMVTIFPLLGLLNHLSGNLQVLQKRRSVPRQERQGHLNKKLMKWMSMSQQQQRMKQKRGWP